MKLMSCVLVFCLSLQAFAGPTSSSLKEMLESHQYFLTVEWDQKDMNHLNQENERFLKELSRVDEKELSKYIERSVSPEVHTIMQTKLKSALKSGQHENVTSLLQEISKDSYAKGANWNGVTIGLAVVGGLTLTAFVAYTWFIHNQLECDGFYDCHGGE